jgi:sec-independent protein translocase protein TatB
MNVFGIGTGELLLILVIVLLVMGPERIPQLARQWGKLARTLNQFTRTWREISAEINRQINLEEMASASPKPKPAPAPPSAPVGEPNNTIAPPEKQPPAAQPEGEAEVPRAPSDMSVVPAESDASLTSTAIPAAQATEPHHE